MLNDAAPVPPDRGRPRVGTGSRNRGKPPRLELCRPDIDPGVDFATSLPELTEPIPILPGIEPLPDVCELSVAQGQAAWLTCKCPGKPGDNEDAVTAIPSGPEQGLLMVADGLGGHRGGRRASQLIKSQLRRAAQQFVASGQSRSVIISGIVPVPCQSAGRNRPISQDHRAFILNEIERVNQRLLRSRIGSATTLALIEIQGRRVRSYHVGDSEILIVSQRGRLKYSSVSHSPIGYAVESGLLTEEEALFHPDRHLVSNVIGSDQMSVELGPWMTLSPRDTVLLASDGLFDNLLLGEIVAGIRKGKLAGCVRSLAELARSRMLVPGLDSPSKPDDLSILAYRCGSSSPRPIESLH